MRNATLIPAYPNPFNQEIQIPYILNNEVEVNLVVMDLLGRVVKHLIDHQYQPSGNYSVQWDGTNSSGVDVASGIYFPTLIIKNKLYSQKVLLKR